MIHIPAALLILGSFAFTAPADDDFFLKGGRRVVFLGDSNTHAGMYVQDVETFLDTRFPVDKYEVINLGLPSETVSGLSEPDHPYPRPNLHERLKRALDRTKPDVVVACYGMNDGIYYPFGEERFARYREGIEALIRQVEAAGARIVLVTPPPFDAGAIADKVLPHGADKYSWMTPYRDYDRTLEKYGAWLLSIETRDRMVVDAGGEIRSYLSDVRASDPAYHLASDGIHLNATGDRLIAQALLTAWKAPSIVDRAVIDIKAVKQVQQGGVDKLAVASDSIRFDWTTRIPWPSTPSLDRRLAASKRTVAPINLNRHELVIRGAPAERYLLFEGDDKIGEVRGDQLAKGLDLLAFPALSTNVKSREVGRLAERRERLLSPAWLTDVGHKRPDTPRGEPLEAALKTAREIEVQIRRLCRPATLAITLKAVEK